MKKVKGAVESVVDPKDVSPAWKILQMRLNEEKADKQRELEENKKVAEDNGGFTEVVNKKNSRKRKLKRALEDMKDTDAKEKKMKQGEVVLLEADKTEGEPTHVLAIDCEYVGGGPDGKVDMLARVSIVNDQGAVVYDKYVQPTEKVTDFRTHVSGIRPEHLKYAIPFKTTQKEVSTLLKDRIVVGHALHNDFRVMSLNHRRKDTRDTAKCRCLLEMANLKNRYVSLKLLAKSILGIDIQAGEHDSVTDARVALRLYMQVRKRWEAEAKRFLQ